MTLYTTDSSALLTGNGVAVSFPFTFKVNLTSQLQVYLVADDVSAPILQPSGAYTVVQNANLVGGSVVFVTPPASGVKVSIVRNVALTQTTDITNQGAFFPEIHESVWDNIVSMIQQQQRQIGTALIQTFVGSNRYDAQGARLGGLLDGVLANDAATVQQLASAASSSVPFVQAGTGAIARTVLDKLRETVSLKDFGAVGDGVSDDTAAINRALATGKTVRITPGTYKTNGGHAISLAGQGFIGDGVGPATFMMSNAATPFLTVAAGLNRVQLSGLIVDRSVTATAGGNGIVFAGNTDEAHIENVVVTRQYVGIRLGSTQQSMMRFVTVNKCQSHGILMQNNASVSQLQWFFETVAVGTCVGDGFRADTSAGVQTCLFDTWHNCFTFANTGCGVNLIGTTASPIADVRISDGFYGADGSDEIRISNTGSGIGGDGIISNCFFESSGGSNTGPTFSTPPTNAGSCISLDASNTRMRIIGNRIGTAASYGITSAAATVLISGNIIHDNNLAGLTPNSGVQILAGKATIVGNVIGNSITGAQKIGIACAADNGHIIIGNDLTNNATSATFFPGPIVNSVVMGNAGELVQTWTPGLAFGGASVGMTYTTRVGQFVKYGKKLVATFQIILSAKGSSTGIATVNGFPVAASALSSPSGSIHVTYYSAMASITGAITGNINASGFAGSLFQSGAANSANLSDANFTNTSTIQGTITYLTA